jgi:hypothetical protein
LLLEAGIEGEVAGADNEFAHLISLDRGPKAHGEFSSKEHSIGLRASGAARHLRS